MNEINYHNKFESRKYMLIWIQRKTGPMFWYWHQMEGQLTRKSTPLHRWHISNGSASPLHVRLQPVLPMMVVMVVGMMMVSMIGMLVELDKLGAEPSEGVLAHRARFVLVLPVEVGHVLVRLGAGLRAAAAAAAFLILILILVVMVMLGVDAQVHHHGSVQNDTKGRIQNYKTFQHSIWN